MSKEKRKKKKKIEHFLTLIIIYLLENVTSIQQQEKVGMTFRKLFDYDNNTQLLKTK